MAVGAGDLAKGIKSRWTASGLEGEFTALWPAGRTGRHVALLDNRGSPGQPMPYAVLETAAGTIQHRSSGSTADGAEAKREERWVPVMFRIFAEQVGDGRGSKAVASDLAGKVMSVFGGHPTTPPKNVPLENGGVLVFTYESDFGIGEDDRVHQWILNYTARLDVPVATG